MRFLLVLAIAWLLAAAPAQTKPRDGVLHAVSISDGIYTISGTLDGVQPPRDPVRDLRITRLTADSAEGLRPLLAFKDLRTLEIEAVVGVDLAPLAQLPLETLQITRARDLDLSAIGAIPRSTGAGTPTAASGTRPTARMARPSRRRWPPRGAACTPRHPRY